MRKRRKSPKGQARKQRATELRVDFGRDQVLSGMHQAEDGTFTFYDERGNKVDPVSIEVGWGYMRDKGPKVLARMPALPHSIQTDVSRGLLRFDWVLAVDTNTIDIEGVRVSIAAPHLVRNITFQGRVWNGTLVPQEAFEFHDASQPPERVAWWEIIQRVRAHPEIRAARLAVVVDSDLGRLSEFNARQLPIIDDYRLPEGVELLYGSADGGGQEQITAAAIAECDRRATQILNRRRVLGLPGKYFPAPGRPYSRYAYWQPPGRGPSPVPPGRDSSPGR